MDTTEVLDQLHLRLGIPIETRATAIYTDLGSPDDLPRSVAICPNRKCVAFGCRMGIELHWVDALTGGDLNRWFPLAAPSDCLFFLPQRQEVDSRKKLRLVSSAAGPVAAQLLRSDSSPAKWKYWPTPVAFGRRQSLTRLFFGNLPFPTSTSPPERRPVSLSRQRSDEVQGVLRTVDCDHFRAVPLSDGFHLLFTDPASGLLCLGSDAPLGGPTKLVRKVMFIPPSEEEKPRSTPRQYAVGKALDWGIRVVAVYDDEQVVLYNIASDIVNHLRARHSPTDVWDENSGVFGQSDLLMDSLMNPSGTGSTGITHTGNETSSGEHSPERPLRIAGMMISRSEDDIVDDIAVQTEGGGLSVWLFYRSGRAELKSIYEPRDHRQRMTLVGEDGFIYDNSNESSTDDDINSQLKGKMKAEDEEGVRHITWAPMDDPHDGL